MRFLQILCLAVLHGNFLMVPIRYRPLDLADSGTILQENPVRFIFARIGTFKNPVGDLNAMR
jgi:hypothetical protein